MVRIVDVRERTVSIRSEIQNAWISFREMDTSLVAVISDVVRDGRPVVGFGFGSNGRYSQGGLLRDRFVPRLLGADPADYATGDDLSIDPERAWSIVMRNEKPGGHGERSVAVGVLDMALWDLAAKLQGVPLVRMLSDRYGDGRPDDNVFVYAAGGYYTPGRPIADLQDEMRRYLDAGYTHVKLKIGLATLADDIRRIEAVIAVVGAADHVAVDANARFDVATAVAYATALEPLGLWWYEEPVDPLDYEGLRQVREAYGGRVATGENLFSMTDARNLLRHGGLDPARDVIQVDPSLSYGVVEFARLLPELAAHGWSTRRCIPHGGHQLSLHLAAALHLGGNESYPRVFQPIGGFADGSSPENGYMAVGEAIGIGIEHKAALYAECRHLVG